MTLIGAICDRWRAYTPDTAGQADVEVIAMLEAEGVITIGHGAQGPFAGWGAPAHA